MDVISLVGRIRHISVRAKLPDAKTLAQAFAAATDSLEKLDPAVRPRDSHGLAGGMLELSPTLPCLILPDLHARPEVLVHLVDCRPLGNNLTVAELIDRNQIQVLMVGDGPHTEGPTAAPRWRQAWLEYQNKWLPCPSMTVEMTLAFNAMECVALLLAAFPGKFHFLKGNHENILNEEGHGNHPFGKYAYEGQMAYEWTKDFLGDDFLNSYDAFERSLPLLARGSGFLATHAEPAFALDVEAAIEARQRPEVVQALTWTANDAAEPGALVNTLNNFLPPSAKPNVCIAGHRPVQDRFALRCGGRLIQIHDLDRNQAALVWPGKAFDPIQGIIDLTTEK